MLIFVHVLSIAAVYTVGVLTGAYVMRSMQKEFEKRGISTVPTKGDAKKILNLAEKQGKITNDDVQALLKVSDSTAQRYLSTLTHQGSLHRQGKTKDIHYTLIKS
ncbi:DeoR family transcriptional regulator [Candidatus Saccharibacteria bacterium]|nr:DeoR family transcriptional regulator [Candidatus Saccharibacteria bacterium]